MEIIDNICAAAGYRIRRPSGRYAGQLVALNIAPVITEVVEMITAARLPWKGKTFDAGCANREYNYSSLK